MGDPKKQRKKYSKPGHPWQLARIEEERQLSKEYGFKNKEEIWKHVSFLRAVTGQAKKLVTLSGEQAEKERDFLLNRLKRYGLLSQEAGLDTILSISLRDVLERRLQTLVYKKNLANSIKQARQFITHEHILVDDKVITSPSYLVPLKEESMITFRSSSSLADDEHPERVAARSAKEKGLRQGIVEKTDGDDSGVKKGTGKRQSKKPSVKDKGSSV